MFVSCKHLKVIVIARTKRGKTLFEWRIKESPSPPLLGQGKHYTCMERLLVGQKSRDNARPWWILLFPEAFTLRSILAEGCMCTPVEGPRVGQVWKRNQIIGLKEGKNQEEMTYINDNCLFTVLLLTGGRHILSFQVCISALLLS